MCKIIKTTAHRSSRAWDQGPRSGFGQRGPFEKFATVSPISNPQVEALRQLRIKRGGRERRRMLLVWELR